VKNRKGARPEREKELFLLADDQNPRKGGKRGKKKEDAVPHLSRGGKII